MAESPKDFRGFFLKENQKIIMDDSAGKVRNMDFLRIIFLIVALGSLITWPLPLRAGQIPDHLPAYRVDAGMELIRFNWSEYLDDGFELLTETGWLVGLSYDLESTAKSLGWRHGAGLFFGRVDYDGHTWSLIPVKTDVWYVGAQGYMDATFNFRPASGWTLQPFAGLGGKTWLRMLDDTRTAGGVPVKGLEEWWWSIHGRVGAGAHYSVSCKMSVFAEAGMKLPLHAQNNAYVNGRDAPVRILQYQTRSPFAMCGLRYRAMSMKLTYESQRFNRSDAVASGPEILYQPRSKEDTFCMRVAWTLDF
jgi:hypothetical protein